MRHVYELRENWNYIKSAAGYEAAVKQSGLKVTLPHTWNAVDGQDGGNDYYRGTCWYTRMFERPQYKAGEQVYLEFLGVAMTADVYMNGQKLIHHEGGYSAFRVNITDFLKEENNLAVSVDNSDNDHVYPQKADFTFYGGIYRMVNMIVVPESHFDFNQAGAGIKVTPEVEVDALKNPTGMTTVTVEAWVKGNPDMVTISLYEENKENKENKESKEKTEQCDKCFMYKEVEVIDGKATAVFTFDHVHLWNGVKDPYLYTAKAEIKAGDVIETRFGCRSFYTDPEKGFMLNGQSYPLRGVSRHQDWAEAGNALDIQKHQEDMRLIKEIGANTIRLAHYQHAQEFYDLCDENGMVIWAEIPFITMFMKNGKENTLSQMKELIAQNYNHPSIVCWGLSNEITAASPVSEELLENHRQLNELCHHMDSTRFTTMANVFMQEADSPLLDIPDVNSYNLYFGWYLGELEQNDEFFDEFHQKYPNRCIGFSEYGADANVQYQSITPVHGDYSETYQTVYHEHILKMIEKRPYLWATHVWNMFDFAADGRDEGGKHGVNQKGLITMDRKVKKDAFYLYKAYWNKEEKFVHICGRRYIDRVEPETEIKVYSNDSEVSLYVNGQLYETQTGEKIFRFRLPITEKEAMYQITAKSGEAEDTIQIRKVDQVNPDYVMGDIKEVVNWFDGEEYKPDCYSIKDTMAELQASPRVGAILAQMMEKGSSARGDVAESVKDNPNLQRMMGRMTLESMLGHMKDSITEDQVKGLNRMLQQIKKGE